MNHLNQNVIITCAVTGGGEKSKSHPSIPVTPKEIAAAAIEAAKAGAAIAHCHVRDPETGHGIYSLDLFREVVDRIRESDTDVVINLTGGGQGMLYIDDDNPRSLLPSSDIASPAARMEHAEKLLPEIFSLDTGSLNWGENAVYAGHRSVLRKMARRLQEIGVKPEIEVFDVGPIVLARGLIDEGIFDAPPMFQFCLGVGQNAPATTNVLLAMRELLPEGAVWSSFGISRHQIPMIAQSVLLGGNVRVGLEDNLYLERGVFASNGTLVERAVQIVEHLGAKVLSPNEARKVLKLQKRAQ
jgi:uncharacterized protein (DUF849 family)